MNKTKGQLDEIIKSIGNNSDRSMSVTEAETMKFLQKQIEEYKASVEKFEKSLSTKDSREIFPSLVELTVRSNSVMAVLSSPTTMTAFQSPSLMSVLSKLIGVATSAVGEAVAEVKPILRDLGVDSVSLNVNPSPPGVSLSLVVKHAQ